MQRKMMIIVIVFILKVCSPLYSQDISCGDVNSDSTVDIVDALVTAQFYIGLIQPSEINNWAANVNNDDYIDIIDALLIGQYYVGLIPELACKKSSSRNVIQLTESSLINYSNTLFPHVYLIADDTAGHNYIAFLHTGKNITAIDENQNLLWQTQIDITQHGGLFGGFDFNSDGWPDLGLAGRTDEKVGNCGSSGDPAKQDVKKTFIVFFSGKSGEIYRPVAPIEDYCFDMNGIPEVSDYLVTQYNPYSVLFGMGSNTLLITPSYATISWFLTYNHELNSFEQEYLYYPSSPSYVHYYNNAYSYIKDAHIANGLIMSQGEDQRLVFFTYGKLLHYKCAPYSRDQLMIDLSITNHEDGKTFYRNYGLIQVDPNYPENVALIAGTNAYILFMDTLNGTMEYDAYGGLHRHVTIHSTKYLTYGDKFYSQTDSTRPQYQYEGRVVYPDNVFIKVKQDSPSRLCYNVYSKGRWHFHISEPNVIMDKYALKDLFVWDIRDIDGNGIDEIIGSPTRWKSDPDIPGYYFPKIQTNIYHWNETDKSMPCTKTFAGLPNLTPRFKSGDRSTTKQYLYPVQVLDEGGKINLVLHDLNEIQIVEY